MRILFTGVVLQQCWPGGEPKIARLLDRVFSDNGILVTKSFVQRDRPRKWSPLNPWVAQSVLYHKVVSA